MRQSHVRFTYLRWFCGSAVSFCDDGVAAGNPPSQSSSGAIGLFRRIRTAFFVQAQITTGLTGFSGLYMLIRFDL
jgi:hypothetical protein